MRMRFHLNINAERNDEHELAVVVTDVLRQAVPLIGAGYQVGAARDSDGKLVGSWNVMRDGSPQ